MCISKARVIIRSWKLDQKYGLEKQQNWLCNPAWANQAQKNTLTSQIYLKIGTKNMYKKKEAIELKYCVKSSEIFREPSNVSSSKLITFCGDWAARLVLIADFIQKLLSSVYSPLLLFAIQQFQNKLSDCFSKQTS